MCVCASSQASLRRACTSIYVDVCTSLNYTSLVTAECVQGSVLTQVSVNVRSLSQQWVSNGINGKNGCTLVYTWGLHCWWGNFYHPKMQRGNETQFTLALHTVAHKHEWRYHFWNGTGGVWWHLAWELSTLIARAIKSVEKGPGAYVQNTFGNMLSFVSRTKLVAFGWKATAPFL